MKKLLLLSSMLVFSSVSLASHMVSGYTRSNGTYVEPHMSQDPGEARSSGYSYHDDQLVQNNDNSSDNMDLNSDSNQY